MTTKDGRFCDRCGIPLTKQNNKSGYEICDRCNEILEKQCAEESEGKNDIKTEINSSYVKEENDYDKGRNYSLYMAMQIINKHLSEVNKQ